MSNRHENPLTWDYRLIQRRLEWVQVQPARSICPMIARAMEMSSITIFLLHLNHVGETVNANVYAKEMYPTQRI